MKLIKNRKKSLFIYGVLALTLLLTACGSVEGKTKEIHIGYQKNGTMLTLKGNGDLQKELEDKGYKVTWAEFNTGSSILEALNAGSIDFAGAGDVPSIFALDKGSDFKYIASEPSAPAGEGILVSESSSIKSLEDLEGKKIAFNKASISQYLLTSALESVDLTIDDIESVHLTPPDASIAFEKGDVDAWVVWDPYMADAESRGNIILQDATDIVPFRSFFFSTNKMAAEHPEIVKLYVDHLVRVGREIDKDPVKVAELMEKETNIKTSTWANVLKRRNSNVEFINEAAVQDLQVEAKDLLEMGLIENDIEFENNIWHPEDE